MKLAVEVVNATELMPKDGQGSSNPYVEVDFDGQVQRTQTKHKDLSPSWNETLVFEVSDPSSFVQRTIDVSVFHDRGQSHHRGNFLGRVRLSAVSVAASKDEAVVQRFPLDKRGLFSHIRGDIALRVYLIQTPNSAPILPTPDANPANFPIPKSSVEPAEQAPVEKEVKKEKKKKDEEPRVFYSVGAGEKPKAEKVVVEEKVSHAEKAPPGAAVFHVKPPGLGGMPQRAVSELEETRPPLAARQRNIGNNKISSTYDLVEQMSFLYVNVVKAKDLPTMDITGSLDPYVEVKLGNYKGTTKHHEKNQNPIFHQVFAFSKSRLQSNLVEVIVKDKDFIKDDYVGRVAFDLNEVPLRVPPDSPLAPQWYRLEDKKGEKLTHGEIMLAVWVGTQADESFPDAWHSDAHNVTLDGMVNTRSKVYFSPKLMYLRVVAMEAQDLVPIDKGRPVNAALRIQLGNQIRRTKPQQSINPIWSEEFMFVASEPLDEPLVITVEDRVGPNRDEPLGRLVIPLVPPNVPKVDHGKIVPPKWYSLAKPNASVDESAEGEKKKEHKFSSKVHLRLYLDTAYHVLDESTHYSSDLQPASKMLKKSSIGILELGILNARNLMPMKAKDGRTTDAYCVAKYGNKWVRTRTLLNTLTPQWNEQYTWEVFDPCTVVTIAVFDNCHVSGQHGDAKDVRIGKVRIRLSTLEIDRVYTHFYPLLVLTTSGLKKTGELHLALRFTCTAWVNMMAMYGKPLLPKMHYTHPISVIHLEYLRRQAMQIVAARLARAEPPLRTEVVEYMLDVDLHMWSLRRSKANFGRITSLLSGLTSIAKWFDGVRSWRNPITTILVHVLFLILVCYPELILPTIFLFLFIIGIWNYRFRPRHPPHMDAKLSLAEFAHPDELDEEFDTFPTSKASDIVRMRYDRMRSIAGKVQTVAGDLATQGERAQAILSWRDPRATAIFIIISLVVAIVLFVTPFQVIAVVVGIFLLRHPKFRSKMPSAPFNFYRRLPAKSDMLL